MDMIAKQAKVSKGSLYWHFKSKKDLFITLKKSQVERVIQALEQTIGEGKTFEEKLKKGLDMYLVPLMRNNRRNAKLNIEFWASTLRIPRIANILRDQYDSLKTFINSIMADAIKKGEIMADTDIDSLSTILLGTLDGLLIHWTMLDRPFDWTKIRDTLYKTVLYGVKESQRRG